MADLFSVTAPLLLRRLNGDSLPVLRAYSHTDGVVLLGLYDAEQDPAEALFLIKGKLQGDGPWKIGDYVISVLGCQNTHPEPANMYAHWKQGVEAGEIPMPDVQIIEKAVKSIKL